MTGMKIHMPRSISILAESAMKSSNRVKSSWNFHAHISNILSVSHINHGEWITLAPLVEFSSKEDELLICK